MFHIKWFYLPESILVFAIFKPVIYPYSSQLLCFLLLVLACHLGVPRLHPLTDFYEQTPQEPNILRSINWDLQVLWHITQTPFPQPADCIQLGPLTSKPRLPTQDPHGHMQTLGSLVQLPVPGKINLLAWYCLTQEQWNLDG